MNKKIIAAAIVSTLSVSLAGVVYLKMQPKVVVEIIGSTTINSNYDTIRLPGATGMYYTEFPEMKYILDENGMNTFHPNVLEYREQTQSKVEELYRTTNAPREIHGYIRQEESTTVLEIAGYYTDNLGKQVEHRDEIVFDFVFDQGYEYYSSSNRDFAPDVIVIPSNFDDGNKTYVNPNASEEELERNALGDKVVAEFSSYDWVESVFYSFFENTADYFLVFVELNDEISTAPMTEEELSKIASELVNCQVQVSFST